MGVQRGRRRGLPGRCVLRDPAPGHPPGSRGRRGAAGRGQVIPSVRHPSATGRAGRPGPGESHPAVDLPAAGGEVRVHGEHTRDAQEDRPGGGARVTPGPAGLTPAAYASAAGPGGVSAARPGRLGAAVSARRRRHRAARPGVPAAGSATASQRAGAVVPPGRIRPARTSSSPLTPVGARLIHRPTWSPRMTTPPDLSR